MMTFEERVARIKAQNEKQKEARRIRAKERSREKIRLKREEKAANGTLTNRGRKLLEDVPEEIRRIKSIPISQLSDTEVEILYKYQQSHIKAYWDRKKELKKQKEFEEQQQRDKEFVLLDLNRRRHEKYDEWVENLARERFFRKYGVKYDLIHPYEAMRDRMEFIKQKIHYEFKFRRIESFNEDPEPLMVFLTKEEAKDLETNQGVERTKRIRGPGRPRGPRRKVEDVSLEKVQAFNDKEFSMFLKHESALSRKRSYLNASVQMDLSNRPHLTENASEVKKRQLAERWNAIKRKRQEERSRKLAQEQAQKAIERDEAREAKQLEIEQLRDFFDHFGMRYMRKKIITSAVIRNHLLPLKRKYSPEVFQEYAYSFCLIKGHMYSLSEEELDALEIEFQRTGTVPTKLYVRS